MYSLYDNTAMYGQYGRVSDYLSISYDYARNNFVLLKIMIQL